MASLTTYTRGWKIRYRLYFPAGGSVARYAYCTERRAAEDLLAHARSFETLTRDHLLMPAVPRPISIMACCGWRTWRATFSAWIEGLFLKHVSVPFPRVSQAA
jgi:hypothetical protein